MAILVKSCIEHSITAILPTAYIEAVGISVVLSGVEHVIKNAYQTPKFVRSHRSK